MKTESDSEIWLPWVSEFKKTASCDRNEYSILGAFVRGTCWKHSPCQSYHEIIAGYPMVCIENHYKKGL